MTETESRQARRYAGFGALAAVVLFGTGSAIWGFDMPAAGASTAEVVDFYRDTSDRIVVGASLSLLSIAGFVLFAAAMRRVLTDSGGDVVLADTAFAGALLGLASGLGAETINMFAALRARDGELSEPLAQSLFEVSQALGSTATGVGIGIFALATAVVTVRAGTVLPRALGLAVGALGFVLLTPVSRVNVLPGAVLIVIVAMLAIGLLWRERSARALHVDAG